MIIHIGYHKTASTFLQKNYFIDENNFSPVFESRKEIYNKVILLNNFEFEETKIELKQKLDLKISGIVSSGKIPFISEEELSGNPHTGGVISTIIADRLKFLFPSGKIIITIREQKSIIFSVYRQYLKEGGAKPLKRYINPSNSGRIRSFEFDKSFYLYSNLFQYYKNNFSNVALLQMEGLRKDSESFLSALNIFTGAEDLIFKDFQKANQGMTGITSIILRFYNKMFSGGRLNTAFFITLPRGLRVRLMKVSNQLTRPLKILNKVVDKADRSKVEKYVNNYYKHDNRELGIYN
jgi:hypothetical protein